MTDALTNGDAARASETREGYVEVKGGKVWYRVAGINKPGIPLLTLHGGPGFPHDALTPLSALAAERPVIFYDQLGCGKSERPQDNSLWTISRFASELEAVRQALSVDYCHLLGHSWGSMLAVAYYLPRRSRKVASLILSGPCLSVPFWCRDQRRLLEGLPAGMQEAVRASEAAGDFTSPGYQEAVAAYYREHVCRLDPWPEPFQVAFRGLGVPVYEQMWGPSEFTCTGTLKDRDYTMRLREINIPVLFTCGQYDEATPQTTAYYQNCLPGSEMIVFEEASHAHMLEKEAPYLAAVRSFLKRVESE